MLDWLRELRSDLSYMRGEWSYPGIDSEWRVAKRVVAKRGKEPTKWRVYREVRRRRRREGALG